MKKSVLITTGLILAVLMVGCADKAEVSEEPTASVIELTDSSASEEAETAPVTNTDPGKETDEVIVAEDQEENASEDLTGRWDSCRAVNSETGEETRNMSDVFGSSVVQFGSFLELKDDGTFTDAINPITDGSESTTGQYTVKRDYMMVGDAYVFLTYSDGREEELQLLDLDGNGEPYLVFNSFINGYQISLSRSE